MILGFIETFKKLFRLIKYNFCISPPEVNFAFFEKRGGIGIGKVAVTVRVVPSNVERAPVS